MMKPTAVSIRVFASSVAGALMACCRVLKDRSALATAPPAQAPKIPASASCGPSKAWSSLAYRLTPPTTLPFSVMGSDRVALIPAAAPAPANMRQASSLRASVSSILTSWLLRAACTHGPPSRYCTASRTAIRSSVATKVKVRPSRRTARLTPTSSGTSDRARSASDVRSETRSASPRGDSWASAARVSGSGSTTTGYPAHRVTHLPSWIEPGPGTDFGDATHGLVVGWLVLALGGLFFGRGVRAVQGAREKGCDHRPGEWSGEVDPQVR